jgi:hypothetical protein
MKHLIVAATIAILISFTASAQTGVDAMAKRQAHDVANQNNNRGMPPGMTTARPAAPAAPTVSATPMTSGQQAYAAFQSRLLSINTNSPAASKDDLSKSMANVAQGANKPSPATVSKLTDHLTVALNEATKLTSSKKIHVAQYVAVLLNSANTQPTQKETMIKDVQSTLEAGGASSDSAAAVAADLHAVADEVKAK